MAEAPTAASEQQTRSAPEAWSREDDSLLDVLAFDSTARQRLSARQGASQPTASPPAPRR